MTTRTLKKRPLSWPFRLFGWLVLFVTVIVALTSALFFGSATYYELTRTKAGDIDAMVEDELRLGFTTDQVIMFLDRHRIEHGAAEPASPTDSRLQDVDLPEGAVIVSGLIRNDGYSLDLVDVEVVFVLDAEGRLQDHVVHEIAR